MKYVNKFMRIFNFPFYFRGEVYDPFETVTLSEQSFDVLSNCNEEYVNEDLSIYTDWSFTLEYMKYVNKFMRIFNFPFYFRGEVYDPFETVTLSEQSFDVLLKNM